MKQKRERIYLLYNAMKKKTVQGDTHIVWIEAQGVVPHGQ